MKCSYYSNVATIKICWFFEKICFLAKKPPESGHFYLRTYAGGYIYIYIYIYIRVLCCWYHIPTFRVRNSILNWVSKTQSLKRKKGKRYLKVHKAFLICNNLLKIYFMLIVSKSMKTLRFHTFADLWCRMMHVMC